jgi:hypothetical protein
MDFLYQNLVAPVVPFLPWLMIIGAAAIMGWFVMLFIRPTK